MHKKLTFTLLLASLLLVGLMVPQFAVVAQDQQPVKALVVPTGNLTPGFLSGNTGGNLASAVYDYLFRIDENGDTVPSLVKSYETSEDLTEWTMDLHKGVTFHNGSKLTAEDVVYTFERLIDPDVGTVLLGAYGPLIDSVEKVDEYTVKFNLSEPNAALHKKLTDYNAAVISSEYNYEELGNTEPMGSGAFKVDKVVPQNRVVCSANEDYWMDGVPKIDKLTFQMIPDKNTAVRMMSSGQGDVISDLGPDQFLRLQAKSNVNTLKEQYIGPVIIDLNVNKEPFDDPKVRKALAYTLDRKSLLESAGYGLGVVGNDTLFPKWHKFYDNLGGIRQRDIEKAKSLLKEAGYPDGVNVTLYCGSNIPPVLSVALTVQEMAKAAGFKIELHTVPRDMYLSQYWGKVALSATQWGHREDITQLLSLAFGCDSSWNASGYCNEQFDENVAKVAGEMDEDKRQEYFTKIQEIMHEEVPSIIPMFKDYLGATSDRIKGFYLTQNFINDFRYIEYKN